MIYLDYQATTPVDPKVIESMLPFFSTYYGNAASSHKFGREIDRIVESKRKIIADSLHCSPNEIYFTSGSTESINLILKGFFDKQTGTIVTQTTEHNAVLNTCNYLEKKGVNVKYTDVDENGIIDLNQLNVNLKNNNKTLASIMHVNNETGVIQPIEEVSVLCKANNVPLFVDASQSFGKIDINVEKMNISMLALSGHKIYGPKGIGVLYVNKKVKNKISPLFHGGNQESGLRSGTLNVPAIVGLSKAVKLVISEMESEKLRLLNLRTLLYQTLNESLKDVLLNGDLYHRISSNLNISFKNVSSDLLVRSLNDVIISNGSACDSLFNTGSHVLKAMGKSNDIIESSIRISLGRYTTQEDIEKAATEIISKVKMIRNITQI